MRRSLPPLKSLLAFEPASRHLSITLPADELCVTPAAISYHLKLLEEWFNTPLLRHERRNTVLTDDKHKHPYPYGTPSQEQAHA